MHDETPSGIATKDRTLALWTDPANFPEYKTLNDVEFEKIVSKL